jgi:hypothetical protein
MPDANASPSSVPSAASTPATPTKSVGNELKPAGVNVTAAPKTAPQSEETFDVQIDGRTEKKTKKEILEAYQLRQLSDKRRSEADKVLGDFNKLQELSKRDPIKFMRAMGHNFDDIATQYLARKAEDAMKDPKVLEAEHTKAELEQYKKWAQEQKSIQEQAQKKAQIDQIRGQLHAEIIEAVKDASQTLGLPIDEDLIVAVAQNMMVQDKAKKPLNAKEALPAAYAKTQKWLQGMASKMEGEAIVKWLGEDVAKKIRKYDLTQLKAKRSTVNPTGNSISRKPESKEAPKKAYKTWSEFKAETLDKIK